MTLQPRSPAILPRDADRIEAAPEPRDHAGAGLELGDLPLTAGMAIGEADPMKSRAIVRLVGVLVAVPLAGCSVSVSSWSLSKSVRSSSHSSDSSSSSSPGAERAYQEDVTDYTRAYAKSHRGDFAGFQADLARLAEEHGITTSGGSRGAKATPVQPVSAPRGSARVSYPRAGRA